MRFKRLFLSSSVLTPTVGALLVLWGVLGQIGHAYASIAVVQVATSTSSGASSVISKSVTLTADTKVIVECSSYSNPPRTVSVSDGANVYTEYASSTDAVTGFGTTASFWSDITSGGSKTVTCTFSGNTGGDRYLGLVEISGAETGAPETTINNAKGSSAVVNTGTITPTVAEDFIIGNAMVADCVSSFSPNNPTLFSSVVLIQSGSCGDRASVMWYGVASIATGYDSGGTLSSSGWWSAVVGAFKPLGGGGGGGGAPSLDINEETKSQTLQVVAFLLQAVTMGVVVGTFGSIMIRPFKIIFKR